MIHSSIDNFQPEQLPISEQKADTLSVSQSIANAVLHEGGQFRKGDIIVWHEDYAKNIFKELRKRGFVVDIGRCTGNIWTPGRKKKLTWMLKDFKKQWCIEILENI